MGFGKGVTLKPIGRRRRRRRRETTTPKARTRKRALRALLFLLLLHRRRYFFSLSLSFVLLLLVLLLLVLRTSSLSPVLWGDDISIARSFDRARAKREPEVCSKTHRRLLSSTSSFGSNVWFLFLRGIIPTTPTMDSRTLSKSQCTVLQPPNP